MRPSGRTLSSAWAERRFVGAAVAVRRPCFAVGAEQRTRRLARCLSVPSRSLSKTSQSQSLKSFVPLRQMWEVAARAHTQPQHHERRHKAAAALHKKTAAGTAAAAVVGVAAAVAAADADSCSTRWELVAWGSR